MRFEITKRLTIALANAGAGQGANPLEGIEVMKFDSLFSGAGVSALLEAWKTDYLLLVLPGGPDSVVEFGARALERFIQVADDSGAGWLYSDFRQRNGGEVSDHPLIDYQPGSIRDNFDFGSVLLLSRKAIDVALQRYGAVDGGVQRGGLYDLRLKLSIDSQVLRIPEPLYTRKVADARESGEKIFDYVDPRQLDYQIEMEQIATAHLKRIGAWLKPEFAAVTEPSETFPFKASVIVPVRNRVKTIADAVRSALAQAADFPFNVIVVDNHSTDGTTDVLRELATDNGVGLGNGDSSNGSGLSPGGSSNGSDSSPGGSSNGSGLGPGDSSNGSGLSPGDSSNGSGLSPDGSSHDFGLGRLVHLIPSHTDLGIGGCWNEAVSSEHCGRYAVQLDSDDIYSSPRTLSRVVAEFERGKYAMVIGSYTIVDFELNELPPGLIDHREWTRENGRNNALRINGLGAPRAFDVTVLRQIGLPNTSYGEDYAVALRISREYEIGRIYDSLYFARRWSGNSDNALPLATANRYDTYKDRLRTLEILARQQFNAERERG